MKHKYIAAVAIIICNDIRNNILATCNVMYAFRGVVLFDFTSAM